MKHFNFSLASVLRYRQRKEELEQYKLAETLQRADAEKRLVEGLITEKTEAISQGNVSEININMMCQREEYISYLDFCLEKQKKHLEEALEEVKRSRAQLIDAARERKVVEVLKEKKLEEYANNLKKEEQKLLDEVGIASYCRKAD